VPASSLALLNAKDFVMPMSAAAVPTQPSLTPLVQQATVEFCSQPTEAKVEVDGQYVISTFSKIAIPQGEHTITIRKRGFAPWQGTIRFASENVRVEAYMEQETCTIHIGH